MAVTSAVVASRDFVELVFMFVRMAVRSAVVASDNFMTVTSVPVGKN